MKNSLSFFIAVLYLILCGSLESCGHPHFIWDPEIATTIHDRSIDRSARISLYGGDTLSGYSIVVHQDSTRWLAASDALMKTLPTSRIDYVEVSIPKIANGLIGGGFIGLLIGDLTRLAVAPNESGFHPIPTAGLLIGGLFGAIIGNAATTCYYNFADTPVK